MKYPKFLLLKDKRARLADVRIKICRESNPLEPCENEDLVFEKAEDESLIPANAIYKFAFKPIDHEPIWFFTTAERCKVMVSKDPAYWTQEKLAKLASVENDLYADWYSNKVYFIVREKWDPQDRSWKLIDSLFGAYGEKAVEGLLENCYQEGDAIVADDDEIASELSISWPFETLQK